VDRHLHTPATTALFHLFSCPKQSTSSRDLPLLSLLQVRFEAGSSRGQPVVFILQKPGPPHDPEGGSPSLWHQSTSSLPLNGLQPFDEDDGRYVNEYAGLDGRNKLFT